MSQVVQLVSMNYEPFISVCQAEMSRSEKYHDPAAGLRLEQAIIRMWPSKGAFAEALHVAPQSVSRWIGGRLPAGYEMLKIAIALPGQIEWILTGRYATAIEQASPLPEAALPQNRSIP